MSLQINGSSFLMKNAMENICIVTENLDKKMVNDGCMFSYSIRFELAAAATIALAMKTSATLETRFKTPIVTSDKDTNHDYYHDITFSGGSNVLSDIVNVNFDSDNITTAQELKTGVSVSDWGTQILLNNIPATLEGNTSLETIGWKVAKDTYYGAKIENLAALQSALITVNLFWYETKEGVLI